MTLCKKLVSHQGTWLSSHTQVASQEKQPYPTVVQTQLVKDMRGKNTMAGQSKERREEWKLDLGGATVIQL